MQTLSSPTATTQYDARDTRNPYPQYKGENVTVDIIPVDLIIVGLPPVDINDVEAILVQVILCRP